MSNPKNTVLYIGITSNLLKRVYTLKSKTVPGFTAKYNYIKLVYYEQYQDPLTAIKREKAIKNLVRRKKEQLINQLNPTRKDLYQILSAS